jgi:TldD protein
MKSLLAHAINAAMVLGKRHGIQYADARGITRRQQEVHARTMKNGGPLEESTSGTEETSCGLGIRVILENGEGFADCNDLNKKGVERAVAHALTLARCASGANRKPIRLAPEQSYQDLNWVAPYKINPFDVSVAEKQALLLQANRLALKERLVEMAVGITTCEEEDKWIATSLGTMLRMKSFITSIFIDATAYHKDDYIVRAFPSGFGGQYELGGWEITEKWPILEHAPIIAREAAQAVRSRLCPQETMSVMIDPFLLALFLHETLGHGSELDRVLGHEQGFMGASIFDLRHLRRGMRVGSELINVVSDPQSPGALGSYPYDDEGVRRRSTTIVEAGILRGHLSSRETAAATGLEFSNGSMRSMGNEYPALVRMGNFSVLPGDGGSAEALREKLGNGLEIVGFQGWSAGELRQDVMLTAPLGYIIKDGQRAGMYRNPSFCGQTTKLWNSCFALGSEGIHVGIPMCGKGQPMQTLGTAHGAVPALFRNVPVGVASAEATRWKRSLYHHASLPRSPKGRRAFRCC